MRLLMLHLLAIWLIINAGISWTDATLESVVNTTTTASISEQSRANNNNNNNDYPETALYEEEALSPLPGLLFPRESETREV